jgi:ribosomal-protein-alanine N-acetyltransferase
MRQMRKEDVNQVTEIDREAFSNQWPPTDYQHELKNRMAHYVVACDAGQKVEPGGTGVSGNGGGGLAARLKRLFTRKAASGAAPPDADQHLIIGFVGFWIMADEAHITSIAVRQAYQGRGIGELLLLSAIEMAQELRASIVTLEVRVSNKVAQSLYAKYGFTPAGIRRGYYIDRGPRGEEREDGLIMTTEELTSVAFQRRLKQLKQAYSEKWGVPQTSRLTRS